MYTVFDDDNKPWIVCESESRARFEVLKLEQFHPGLKFRIKWHGFGYTQTLIFALKRLAKSLQVLGMAITQTFKGKERNK